MAPSAANRRAMASPLPEPAPVTMLTLPSSRPTRARLCYWTVHRRAFLRRAAWLAAAPVGASLAAACAPAAAPAPTSAPPAAATPTAAAVGTTAPAAAATTAPAATAAPAVATAPTAVLNFAKPGKVQTRDPQKAYDLNMFVLMRNVYEPLVDLDQQGKLYGVLAESWQPSADAKTWTIKLRQGVKFQDGTPFDAESVKATVARAKGNTKSAFAFVFKDFEDDEPVRAVDAHTVELRTKIPIAPLMNNIVVLYMVPPRAGSNLDMTFEDAVGTGPFRLTDYNLDQQYVLEANTDYWQKGLPKLGKVVYRPILEQSSLVAALRSGQADLIEGISEENVATIANDPNFKIIRSHLWQTDFLTFNGETNPTLANPAVRRAFNYALDRDVIANDILAGNAQPLASYPPRGILGYTEKPPIAVNPYDVDRAKKELADAGLTSVEAELKLPDGQFTKGKEIAQFVVQELGKIGVKLTLNAQEPIPALNSFIAGQYEIGYAGSIAVTGDPDRYLQERVVGDLYHTKFADDEARSLIRQAASVTDPAQRQALYEQAAIRVWDQPPFIYLHQIDWNYAARSKLKTFTWMPNRVFSFIDTELS
jgi:peptide/nickel transport system substrate-binding protein